MSVTSPSRPKTAYTSTPAVTTGPCMRRTDERITCPVPEEGVEHAVRLMREGRLFRYTYPSDEQSPVSVCEGAVAEYCGFKYCIAVNSGASALYLTLRGAGVPEGSKVLCNAFTFGAVPSAIVHAGCEVVYVETRSDYTIDVDDLRRTLAEHPDASALMLSHMRGRVGEMDAIAAACKEAGVTLLEDCAHSLGVRYNGQHTGHHGVACGISAQSFKMLNSGEGGFVLTDDPMIAMRAAVLAGAYESNAQKHVRLPAPDSDPRFAALPVELPNLSLRMSALSAAILTPQVGTLDERIAKYHARYEKLAAALTSPACPAARLALEVPDDLPEVFPVHDELLFTIRADVLDAAVAAEESGKSPEAARAALVARFQAACAERDLLMNLFGSKTNARNYVNWRFAPADQTMANIPDALPQTRDLITRSFGIRMPLQWSDEEIAEIGDVLDWCSAEVFGHVL